MLDTLFLHTVKIPIEWTFPEIFMKFRHRDVIWRRFVGFCRILAGFRSLSVLRWPQSRKKTVKLANDCSCMIQCYLLALKWGVNQLQATKTKFTVKIFPGPPENPSKMLILMTSSVKSDDVITTVNFFWWKSKVLMIVVNTTKFSVHSIISSCKI